MTFKLNINQAIDMLACKLANAEEDGQTGLSGVRIGADKLSLERSLSFLIDVEKSGCTDGSVTLSEEEMKRLL
jgi:hypothetical protein